MRRLFLAALFLGIWPVLSATPALGATVNCGDVITADTTLTADLTGCVGDGLIIVGSGITLDLGGHTISGVAGSQTGISVFSTNATVTNGRVTGFGIGVDSEGGGSPPPPPGPVITHLQLDHNGLGFRTFQSYNTTFSQNHVFDNGGGLFIDEFSGTVSDNVIEHNTGIGFRSGPDASFTADHNVVIDNGSAGFFMQSSVPLLHGNVASANGGDGIYLDTLYEIDCSVDVFQGNIANRNTGHGIEVHFPADTPTESCTYDHGGNSASYNLTEPQCVNITCTTMTDTTPPVCRLVATTPGPPKRIVVMIEDTGSGVHDVSVITKTNANVDVSPFEPGTTETILATGTKLNQANASVVALHVQDSVGNVTECDPVIPGVKKTVHRRHKNNTR